MAVLVELRSVLEAERHRRHFQETFGSKALSDHLGDGSFDAGSDVEFDRGTRDSVPGAEPKPQSEQRDG